jgi:hypothetical protein
MGTIVGFSLYTNLEEEAVKKLRASSRKALSIFGHLECKELALGASQLIVWGHEKIFERIHTMPDGSSLVLIGSPHERVNWLDVQDKILSGRFSLPWDGRVILLRIRSDGNHWTLWNDWLGSIPAYHAKVGRGRIVSTLEPVTVAAAGYTPNDFFLPGLVSLLLNGHFISDWTLYKGMNIIPPDSEMEWGENGFRAKRLWTVEPSQSRWESSWDDLADEMHELSHKAISDALKMQPRWILPLSSGLDSRLIAGVAADVGAEVYTYVWGESNTTDVIFSHRIARVLGLPWKHIHLPKNFLTEHTPGWADWFGSGMHFHGMYQMAFNECIKSEVSGPFLSGFVGDVLAGDAVVDLLQVHSSKSYRVESEWYSSWTPELLKSVVKFPLEEALETNAQTIKEQIESFPGVPFQKIQYLELWNRQRFFTSFQSILADYWRGVATPYMNRDYARFCLSIPLLALDNRQLLSRVFRRYYGKLAVIPGTYAKEPFIITGRYLLLRRIAKLLSPMFHWGQLKGFRDVQLRMDVESIQSTGRDALWPLFDTLKQLSEWLDVDRLEQDYQMIMESKHDIRPLRRIQTAQTLAYRLTRKESSYQ